MLARCYRCQATFETDHFGTQTCPSCGSEVFLPDPSVVPPMGGEPPAAPPPGSALGAPGGTEWSAPAPAAPPTEHEQSAPFAARGQRGVFSAFIETWKLALLEPQRFFRYVRLGESRAAVAFGVISFTIGVWVSLVFQHFTAGALVRFMAKFSAQVGENRSQPFLDMIKQATPAVFAAQLAMTPLLAIILLYLTAAIVHVLLLIVRAAPRGFEATLTLVSYAFGVFLLEAVPMCGGLVACFWFFFVAIVGLAEIQRCGSGKAAFAVLMPLLLLCLCACVAGAVLGVATTASSHVVTPPTSIGL